MECKRRGLTQTCVDGDRKIPKYLYGISKKTPTANLYCATSLLRTNLIPTDDLNFRTLLFDSIDQYGATVATQVDTYANYSTVNGSNDFVDPAILHIESPTLLLSRQMAKRHLTDGSNPMAHFTADTGSLLMPSESNIASHMSESCGEKTSIGFTISSGWSSTFLPCGMCEEPGGPINGSSE